MKNFLEIDLQAGRVESVGVDYSAKPRLCAVDITPQRWLVVFMVPGRTVYLNRASGSQYFPQEYHVWSGKPVAGGRAGFQRLEGNTVVWWVEGRRAAWDADAKGTRRTRG